MVPLLSRLVVFQVHELEHGESDFFTRKAHIDGPATIIVLLCVLWL